MTVKEKQLSPTDDTQQLVADYRYIKENTDDEVEALRLLELTTCLVLQVAPPPHQHH